jgi:hypothetical protein
MRVVTLKMLFGRLATVRREIEDPEGMQDSRPLIAIVNGRRVSLTTDNFSITEDGTLIIDTYSREPRGSEIKEAVCIGCGCDDLDACEDDFGDPCYWLVVDRKAGVGVCSECPGAVDRWSKGDRQVRANLNAIPASPEADEGAQR